MPDAVLTPVNRARPARPSSDPRLLVALPGRIVAGFVFSLAGTLIALVPAVLVGSIINGPISDGDKTRSRRNLLLLLALAAGGFLAMWLGGRVPPSPPRTRCTGCGRRSSSTPRRCRYGSSTASRSAT